MKQVLAAMISPVIFYYDFILFIDQMIVQEWHHRNYSPRASEVFGGGGCTLLSELVNRFKLYSHWKCEICLNRCMFTLFKYFSYNLYTLANNLIQDILELQKPCKMQGKHKGMVMKLPSVQSL